MALDLPAAIVTPVRSGLAVVQAPPDQVHVVIGCCTKGASLAPAAYVDYGTLADVRGAGPGVKGAAYAMARTGGTIVFVRVPATARSAVTSAVDISEVDGTAVPTVSGTPNDGHDVVIQIVDGGTIGTPGITYRYTLDGEDPSGAATALGTATTIALTGTGLTVNLTGAQTFVAGDVFRFHTIPASASILGQTTTKIGSSTATLTLTGTPVDEYELLIEIMSTGTVGTKGITYRYSLDAGNTFSPELQLGTGDTVTLLDGTEDSGLDLEFGDVVAVAATGTITAVAGASLVDGETFTLDDGVNAPTVFEFDSNASVGGGNVAVTFTGGDTATEVRDAMISAITGVGAGLAITPSIGGAALVNLVNDAPGIAGNEAIAETVANAGFIVSGMSGGVDAAAGTLDKGDTLEARTTAPEPQASDVAQAMQNVDDSAHAWSFFHIIAEASTSFAGSVGARLASFAGDADGNATYTSAVLSARDRTQAEDDTSWSARLVEDFSLFADDRLAVGAGKARVTCPITGRRNRRSVSWSVVGELVRRPIQVDPGKKGEGPLPSDVAIYDADQIAVEHDARLNKTLNNARFLTFRSYKKEPGVYITRGNLMSGPTADFNRIAYRRVLDKASEIFRRVLEEQLENDLFANADGTLLETDASVLDREIRTALEQELAGQVSSVTVRVSRTDPVLTNGGRLSAEVRILGKAYIDRFEGTIAYVNPRLAALRLAA